jgi:hypothetical protein
MAQAKWTTDTIAPPLRRQISEAVLGWLRHQTPAALAEQVAGWSAEHWEIARWAIQVHGIGPLLYVRLRQTQCWQELTPALQRYLADQYALNRQRITLLLAELDAILAAASAAGIAVAPLKGGVLATHYYDDPALRPMADLDLLVQPDDESRLARLLIRLGYTPTDATKRHRSYVFGPAQQPIVTTDGEHPDNPHGLELHTAVYERFWGITYDLSADIWAGCRPAQFGSATGTLIEPVMLFQHLLIHASADMLACKARFIRLYDLHLVAPRLSAPDWGRLLDAAQRRREERLLYAPLSVSERYLGPIAPAEVMARLAVGVPPRLHDYLARLDLYHVSFCNPLSIPLGDKLHWYWPGREQLVALRYLLFPSPGEMREYYPRMKRYWGLPLAYLNHGRQVFVWPLQRVLRLPRHAWLHRARGGQ